MTKTYTVIIVALICILFALPLASAAISVGNVALDSNHAVERSNPMLTRSDSALDDTTELSYVTFSIPVTATGQAETVTSVTPNLNGFVYDSFAGTRVNSSMTYFVDTALPLSIPAGQTQYVQLRVLVPSNFDAIDTSYNEVAHTFTANLATSAGAQISTLSFYAENGLQLRKVTLNAIDGTTITCKVTQGTNSLDCNSDADKMPIGKDFSVDFTLKNRLNRDSNIDFNSADVTVDSDNGDVEPADDSFSEDISAGEERLETTTFNVDSSISDGDSARITIEADVVDDNGARHGFSHDFDIRFQAKDYQLGTPVLKVAPTSVCPGDNVVASYTLENLGAREQYNVRPVLSNDGLALNKVMPTIDLKATGRSDDTYHGTTTIAVPANARAGSYPIQMLTYYRDDNNNYDATLLQTATLVVQSCTNGVANTPTNTNTGSSTSGSTSGSSTGSSTANGTSGGVIVVQPGQSGTSGVTGGQTNVVTGGASVPVRAVVADNSDTPYLVGLGIGLVVLLVVVGLLIAAMRK